MLILELMPGNVVLNRYGGTPIFVQTYFMIFLSTFLVLDDFDISLICLIGFSGILAFCIALLVLSCHTLSNASMQLMKTF